MVKQFVESGIADCAMALGFEKMEKGSLGVKFQDRTNPMDKQFELMVSLRGFTPAPPAAQFFGNAGREHMERYGTTPEHFAKIGWKNHKHSVNNPYSQFQDEYTLDQIKNAPMVYEPLTKLQCCPTSDGAGAAILASGALLDPSPALPRRDRPVPARPRARARPGLRLRALLAVPRET